MKRGESSGRADDNIATIKKRFSTFITTSYAVIQEYEKIGKCVTISSIPPPDEVFSEVCLYFKDEAPAFDNQTLSMRSFSVLPKTEPRPASVKEALADSEKSPSSKPETQLATVKIASRPQSVGLTSKNGMSSRPETVGKPSEAPKSAVATRPQTGGSHFSTQNAAPIPNDAIEVGHGEERPFEEE